MAYVFVPIRERILNSCHGLGVYEESFVQTLGQPLRQVLQIAPTDSPDVARAQAIRAFRRLAERLPKERNSLRERVALAELNIEPKEIRKKNLTARRKWAAAEFGISVSTIQRIMKKNAAQFEQTLIPKGRHRRPLSKKGRLVLTVRATKDRLLDVVRGVETAIVRAIAPAVHRLQRQLNGGWIRRPLPSPSAQAGAELAPVSTQATTVATAERQDGPTVAPGEREPIVIILPTREASDELTSRRSLRIGIWVTIIVVLALCTQGLIFVVNRVVQ